MRSTLCSQHFNRKYYRFLRIMPPAIFLACEFGMHCVRETCVDCVCVRTLASHITAIICCNLRVYEHTHERTNRQTQTQTFALMVTTHITAKRKLPYLYGNGNRSSSNSSSECGHLMMPIIRQRNKHMRALWYVVFRTSEPVWSRMLACNVACTWIYHYQAAWRWCTLVIKTKERYIRKATEKKRIAHDLQWLIHNSNIMAFDTPWISHHSICVLDCGWIIHVTQKWHNI